MVRLSSIHSKFIFISILILLFFATYQYTGYVLTSAIAYDATTINFTNKVKAGVLQISWQTGILAEREDVMYEPEEKTVLESRLMSQISMVDETFHILENGNKELGVKPHDSMAHLIIHDIKQIWAGELKPLALKILELPESAHEREAWALVRRYNSKTEAYQVQIDNLLRQLEREHTDALEQYRSCQLYALLCFILSSALIPIYLRKTVIRPVQRLKEETKKIEQGNFNAKVEVRQEGEIGELAGSFNQMARTLERNFNNNMRLITGLKNLHHASKEIVNELHIDILLRKTADNARQLLNCSSALAVIPDKAGGYKHFIPSGEASGVFEKLRTAYGLPTESGLLEHMLKEGKPIYINDVSNSPLFSGLPEGHPCITKLLVVPISLHDDTMGGLYFSDKQGGEEFTSEDEELALSFSHIVSLALKQAEMVEEIKYNEEEYRALVTEINDGFFTADANGKIMFANPAIAEIHGYSNPDEVVGMNIIDFFPPDIKDDVAIKFNASVEKGIFPEIWNLPSMRKDGTIAFIQVKPVPVLYDGRVTGVRGVIRDITRQKTAEDSLRKSEERFNMAVRGSTDGLWDWDIINDTVWFSARFKELIGYEDSELESTFKNWEIRLHPEDHVRTFRSLRNHLNDQTKYDVEYRLKTKSGAYRWFRARGQAIWGSDGKPVRMSGSLLDITDRKQAEHELIKIQESLKKAQQIARMGNWDWDIENNTLEWSDEIYRIFGLKPREFGATYEAFLNAVHPDDREFVADSVAEALNREGLYNIDHRIVQPDGTERIVHEQAEVFLNSEHSPVRMVGTVQDITENKRTDAELQLSNRLLDAINTLQSQFISEIDQHEMFENLLQSILTMTQSEYGFIGETLYTSDERPYLKTYAITNIFWDETTNSFYEKHAPAGMEFHNIKTLFGTVLESGEMVISNSPSSDHRQGGLPAGHPPLTAFLGIPLYSNEKQVGMIGLSNRPGGYDESMATYLEPLVKTCGNIIQAHKNDQLRQRAEEKIERNYQVQNVLNILLQLSLEEVSLEERLKLCLDTVLSVPFLTLMPKGAIFLADEHSDELVMEINRGLPTPLHNLCARVPFGKCLCGIAAAKRRIEFADCVDERHHIRFDNMDPHGHYCVPILSKGTVLGVLVLYLQEGHMRSGEEEEFLKAVADTLAGMIERSRSEKEVGMHTSELMTLADSFNVISAIQLTENIYDAICNIAVRNFGFKMAWIGLIQDEDHTVMPAAYAGIEEGYLSSVNITWDDSPYSRGPVGSAIKTKSFKIINRLESDPSFIPWREEALKRGYLSCMSLPLLDSDADILGTINLYSDEEEHFIKRRIHIFNLFANYASIAIENRLLIEDLEETIEHRTYELEGAKQQAESANRAKTEFLANMSHELRTPLNAIIGFSDIMINDFAGPMTDTQKEYARDILESGRHLLSIINDLLDLSKIEAGKMELELGDFNPDTLVKESLILFKEKSLTHNIRVHSEVSREIDFMTADRRKVKQVMFNLVSNAMKFTPDGGSVTITVRPAPDKDEYAEFSVRDTGIGISEDNYTKLFEPFQQLKSGITNKSKGTGLGLSLCKQFVELHGGSIWVESKEGEGSTFIFNIPLKTEKELILHQAN